MSNNKISVSEALKRLKDGGTLTGLTVDFNGEPIKALDAFQLGKAGMDVPEELIYYDDDDIAYDPDFDDYEWVRTDIDPLGRIKEKLVVSIEVEKDINTWIQKNGIELDHLIEKLIQEFYSAHAEK